MSERAFRESFGFYPTSKDDAAEWEVFCLVRDRAEGFLRFRDLHSGNARDRFHEMFSFSWEEARCLFDFARARPALSRLLPSMEACHAYVMAITLAAISEDDKKRYPRAQHVRPRQVVPKLAVKNKKARVGKLNE
jgi:hypothetical protein